MFFSIVEMFISVRLLLLLQGEGCSRRRRRRRRTETPDADETAAFCLLSCMFVSLVYSFGGENGNKLAGHSPEMF